VLGCSFIYLGARLAPTHKTVTALVLAAAVLVVSAFLLFPLLAGSDWWGVYEIIVLVVAAGSMAWSIYTGEIGEDDFA
jgi:hypothetical protein